MNAVLRLYNAQTSHAAFTQLWSRVKPWLVAGHALELVVRPERRTTTQNAALHAMLSDISEQKDWAGAKRSVEVWKRLVVAAWLRARGDSVEVIPALDGHGVDIVYARTSEMTKAQLMELIDWIACWCAENDVELSDARS